MLNTTKGHIGDLADCLTEQGAACEDYAKQVDETRQTIKDLLKDLAIECGVTAGVSIALSFVTFGGAAAVGAGVIAARAVKYAHRILTALKALKAARAVLKLAKNAPKLNRVRRALEDLKTARKLAQLKQIARPKTKYDPAMLQKKYKHAKDFGVKEPWKKGAGGEVPEGPRRLPRQPDDQAPRRHLQRGPVHPQLQPVHRAGGRHQQVRRLRHWVQDELHTAPARHPRRQARGSLT